MVEDSWVACMKLIRYYRDHLRHLHCLVLSMIKCLYISIIVSKYEIDITQSMASSWSGRNDFLPQIALKWDYTSASDVHPLCMIELFFIRQPFMIDVWGPAYWHLLAPPCALFWCTMLRSRAAIFHPCNFIPICLVHSMVHMIKPLKLKLTEMTFFLRISPLPNTIPYLWGNKYRIT